MPWAIEVLFFESGKRNKPSAVSDDDKDPTLGTKLSEAVNSDKSRRVSLG
jgi:hypothetical protein